MDHYRGSNDQGATPVPQRLPCRELLDTDHRRTPREEDFHEERAAEPPITLPNYLIHWVSKRFLWPWLVYLSGLSAGCEPKGCQFESQLGYMPGLQARSPVGGMQEATTH